MTKPKHEDESGEHAFKSISAELLALKETELAVRTVDVEAVAVAIIGVAKHIESSDLKARMLSLPKKEFDHVHIERLATLAWAAHFAGHRYNLAKASESEAMIPADLAAKSADIEGRMQKLCEYHLGDDPEVGPTLRALAPGSSYRDRAGDLLGYARIVRDHEEMLRSDSKNYQKGDAALAEKLAQQIIEAIGSRDSTEAKQFGDDATRALTLLANAYNEVRSAGLFLERHDPRSFDNYPSIFAVGRGSVGRPRKAKAPAPAPVSEPTKT